MIINLFEEKKGKYGIRRLKMYLKRHHGLDVNLKKIIRIKKKFCLTTTIRKRRQYVATLKVGEEHKSVPNLLKRNFTPGQNEIFLSTDITELRYSNSQKAYLSAVKNLGSKEIVNFYVSSRPTIDLYLAS